MVRGILALSGDLHASFVRTSRVGRRPVLPELTTTAVTAPSFGSHARRKAKLPVTLTTAILKVLNRDIGFIDLRRHGFSLLTIEPERIRVDLHLLDHIDRPTPPSVEVRHFELAAGQSTLTPVTTRTSRPMSPSG
ncbi:MAG: hypothetical protein ACKV2O_24190 [Acidimicrobiales bacterium]